MMSPQGHVLIAGQAVWLPTGLPHLVVILFPSCPVTVHAQVCSWLRVVFLQAAWAQVEGSGV